MAPKARHACAGEASRRTATLDPEDWEAFGRTAHRVLDEALAYLRTVRDRPVWTPVPDELKRRPSGPPPREGEDADSICEQILRQILPYATGNVHPRFFGWVHGSGNAAGIVAEIVAATMNANVGGRDHAAVYVERQVIEWCRRLFGLPRGASGILVSGTSVATLIGLTIARNHHARCDVRSEGMGGQAARLVGYASSAAHGSVARAFELLGLGREALRLIPIDADFRMDIRALRRAIALDRANGHQPFCVIGTAGTVDTGAIDDLHGLAQACAEEGLWFHVDGAFGALAVLSDHLKPRLAGIERADSLAFDFHKWMHVPYDAGCVLVRRGDLHREAFTLHASYLRPAQRGLAGGEPWFCEFGPELSRGFRALKVWFTLKHYGTRRLGAAIENNCDQAHYLAARVRAHRCLELLAPVSLNVVCFRFRTPDLPEEDLDRVSGEIVADLQESGIAAPSTTTIGGRTAIRVSLTNHRTRTSDLDRLLEAVVAIGTRRLGGAVAAPVPPVRERRRRPGRDLAGICDRPELRALSREIRFSINRGVGQLFQVVDGHRISLGAEILEDPPGAVVLLRHALELALWHRLAASRGGTEELAFDGPACRVAGLYLRSLSEPERRAVEAATPEWLLAAYQLFAADAPPSQSDLLRDECLLIVCKLAGLRGAAPSGPDRRATVERMHESLDRFWEVAAPTDHLLITGGGTRLLLDPTTGLNAYGCAPRPTPDVLAFASSTASAVSPAAYEAAEDLRQRLIEAALDQNLDAAFADEVDRTRRRLAVACGIDEESAIDVVLVPSGTDGEFAALHLARWAQGERLVNILMEPNETGSGVPSAARGLHYGPLTPHGTTVEAGAPVQGLDHQRITVPVVELREEDGTARPLEAIDQDAERLADEAVLSGARCLLHLVDGSKSGLRAPSLELARRLRARYPGRLEVVVDACQMRLGSQRIRDYLDAGFMVLVTGSKFFTGPPFSGALLLPERIARKASQADALPAGLGEYFARPEWPQGWSRLRASLPPRRSLGLVLRWEAALSEMAAFEAVPHEQRREIMTGLAEAACRAIEASDHMRLVPLCHHRDGEEPPTIISFQVLQAPGRAPLDPVATRRLHQWLRLDISPWLPPPLSRSVRKFASTPCQVGQPIGLGRHAAALRICIGARLVTEVAFSPELGDTYERRLEQQIGRMRLAVQKAELIARHFEHLAMRADGGDAQAAASA